MAKTQGEPTQARTAYDLIPLIINPVIWQNFDVDAIKARERTCIGITVKSVKCRNRTTRDDRLPIRIGTQIADLEQLDPRNDPDKSCQQINRLLRDLLCWCHRETSIAAVTSWFAKVRRVKVETYHIKPEAARSPSPPIPTKQHGTRSNPAARAALTQPSDSLQSPLLVRYESRHHRGLDSSNCIHDCLDRDWANINEGFLYGFTAANAPGCLKIGRTCDTPERRVRQWREKCGQNIRLEIQTPTKVRSVFALEALVHAELSACRMRFAEACSCGTRHIEFFQTSERHAEAVMFKYWALMKEDPYEQTESNGRWTLRQVLRKDEALLQFLTTPLSVDEEHDPEAVAAEVHQLVAAANAKDDAARKARVARRLIAALKETNLRAAAATKIPHVDRAEIKINAAADATSVGLLPRLEPAEQGAIPPDMTCSLQKISADIQKIQMMMIQAMPLLLQKQQRQIDRQQKQIESLAKLIPMACQTRTGTGLSTCSTDKGAMVRAVVV